MKGANIKNIALICMLLIASAVMLTLIQLPFGWSALAWVALVPFILACSPKAEATLLAVAAYLVSLVYWLGNLYWICPVTWPGWLAFCMYTAVLWPILAFALRYCRTKKLPLFLVVPIVFVGAERLQGLFLGGFFWRFLAHSQYANLKLIQIADIFGTAGLSFLIAMVNGLLAELLIASGQKGVFKIANLLKAAVVAAAVTATVAYGQWRISQAYKFIEPGPLVGLLQSNVPQSVKGSFQASEAIFDQLMQSSNKSAKAGAQLIIWPETMVQATLDPGLLRLLDSSHLARVFDKALKNHSKDTAFVLVGAYGGAAQIQEDFTIHLASRYNSAFLYLPDGTVARQQYSKIHLVPFGEFVPFRKSFPLLYNLLMKFTPYDYDYSLDAGTEYTIFQMAGCPEKLPESYKFSVMICYEDTVPEIARRFAIDENGNKRLDWLVNISNDGWFVLFNRGQVFPSTELAQHAAICAFRAVENRLAVLRSVNTGISCLIDSSGRIKDGFLAGNLPNQAMQRIGCAGWLLDRVPIDTRTTFFSKHGGWLDFCCAICLFVLIITAIVDKKARSRKQQG